MIAAAVSDLHGYLPVPDPIDGVNTLIVAGDVSPISFDRDHSLVMLWLDTNFRDWLESLHEAGFEHIVGIAGNHDFSFWHHPEEIEGLDLPWTYLKDSSAEIDGLKFYGLPWVSNLKYWAFYQPEEGLQQMFGAIPEDTDIIIAHSPPPGYGDGGHPEWCSPAFSAAIERVNPWAYVCGHIHEGYGIYQVPDLRTTVYNVSFVDEVYLPQNRITKVVAHVPARD